jgi:hypothetical protein
VSDLQIFERNTKEIKNEIEKQLIEAIISDRCQESDQNNTEKEASEKWPCMVVLFV